MTAETDLTLLLRNLSPVACEKEYVFVSLPSEKISAEAIQNAKGMFKEEEGITLIVEAQYAEQEGFSFEGRFHCITCKVHSSLDAVGMTAAMSSTLGKAGISANVVAAYYHDHIFVNAHKSQQALDVLTALSKQN